MEEIEKGQADNEITAPRAKVEAGESYRYAVHEGRLYYLSGRDEKVKLRLYVTKGLRAEIVGQYHEGLGRMRIDLMERTYY